MIMQVHDELVFEVPKAALGELEVAIGALMVDAARLEVPLTVGMGSGANWDEAH